jgi:hypothetical protein
MLKLVLQRKRDLQSLRCSLWEGKCMTMNWFKIYDCKVIVFIYISLVVVLMVLHYKVAGCGIWSLVNRSIFVSSGHLYIYTT